MLWNFGDIQETALIPLAIKASETARPNAMVIWFAIMMIYRSKSKIAAIS